MSCLTDNIEKLNDDSTLSETTSQKLSNNEIDTKKINSILKSSQKKTKDNKNVKNTNNNSDLMIPSKKKKLNESTIDMLNDNTLDCFPDESTVMLIGNGDVEDQTSSQDCSQNVVTFNLNETQQEASESSASQKPESNVKKRKRRGSAFHVDQSIAYA